MNWLGIAFALILIGVVVWAVGAPYGGLIILIGILVAVAALIFGAAGAGWRGPRA